MSVPGEAAASTCRHCGKPIERCHAGCSWRHPQPKVGYPVTGCGLTAEPGEDPSDLGAERERIVAAILADLERRMEGYRGAHYALAASALRGLAADLPALVEGTP